MPDPAGVGANIKVCQLKKSITSFSEAIRRAPDAKGEVFVVNLSGRGDKDTDIYRENIPELDMPL